MAYIPPSYDMNKLGKYPPKYNSKVTVGIIIILVGLAFLLKNILPIFPSWIFSWPMFLIVLGIFIGSRYDFKGNSWWILSSLGIIFLIDKVLFSMVFLKPFIFPLILIVIGLLIVVRSRNRQAKIVAQYNDKVTSPTPTQQSINEDDSLIVYQNEEAKITSDPSSQSAYATTNSNTNQSFNNAYDNQQNAYQKFNSAYQDFIQMNSFFGGNTMRVLSKSFKGGSVTCMFGSVELDLTQADFEGLVFIDVFCAFGGTEIFVPGDWNVINELTSVLGGVEDRRRFAAGTNSKKTLVIKGTVMFGGVEIKNG